MADEEGEADEEGQGGEKVDAALVRKERLCEKAGAGACEEGEKGEKGEVWT